MVGISFVQLNNAWEKLLQSLYNSPDISNKAYEKGYGLERVEREL